MTTHNENDLLTLGEARSLVPRRRGKHPSLKTMYRWSSRGCRGVRLRTVQVGGSRMTCSTWVMTFLDELTARSIPGGAASTPTIAQRNQSRKNAEGVLDAAGV
jgi:hypothetical protein